jgi:hypothetical protein
VDLPPLLPHSTPKARLWPRRRRCIELERQLKALLRKKSFYEPEVGRCGGRLRAAELA